MNNLELMMEVMSIDMIGGKMDGFSDEGEEDDSCLVDKDHIFFDDI
jgi:hypothetical protein